MNLFILIAGLIVGASIKLAANGLISEKPMKTFMSSLNMKALIPFVQLRYIREPLYKKEVYESLIIQLMAIILIISLYGKYGAQLLFYKYLFFTLMMLLIGWIDFKTTYVYRSTTLMTLIGGLLFVGLESFQAQSWPIDNFIGFLIGFSVIGLIVFFTRGMGEGDIEIAALCGLLLGMKGAVLTLFFGFVLGGIAGAVLLGLKSKGLKDEMAFGPYLVMGAIIAMLFENEIVKFYLNLYY